MSKQTRTVKIVLTDNCDVVFSLSDNMELDTPFTFAEYVEEQLKAGKFDIVITKTERN